MFDIQLECSLDFLAAEYVDLFERSRATAFQHPVWLHHLYRSLAPRLDAEPLVITARRDRRLVMLLPLLRRRRGPLRVIEFADLEVSDYVAPVCEDAAHAQIADDPLAREKIRALLKPYDLIRIKKIAHRAQPLEQLFGVAKPEPMDVCAHAVGLYAPFSTWRRHNINASYLKELDVKRRRMNRKGAFRFEPIEDPELIGGALAAIRDYRRRRFGDLDVLGRHAYFEFYTDVALHGHANGYSRIFRMSLDGQLIGGVWGLAHHGRFLALLNGSDISNFKQQSIGALLFEDVVQDCIGRGDMVLDFSIGDEPYKQLFGARPSSLWMFSAAATTSGKLAKLVAQKAPWALNVAKDLLHGRPLRSSPARAQPCA